MAILKEANGMYYIAIEDVILIQSRSNNDCKSVKLPEIILPPNLSKGQEDVLKQEHRIITTMSHSKDGKYCAVATNNKQVVVFDSLSQVVANFVLNRVASKVRFTSNNDLLIADKTGDAYLYSINSTNGPSVILGHLSMLLDIIITDNNKFIITCDRDEKIRVSHNPNSYNIQSYCLGHKEFVTNLELIGNILISASGDGTVRFWSYIDGTQLDTIDTNQRVKDKNVIENFCNKMEQDQIEVKALPITDMQIQQIGNISFIGVSLLELNIIQVYTMVENDGKIDVKQLETIVVDNDKLVCFCLGNSLTVLTDRNFITYSLGSNELTKISNGILDSFYVNNLDVFKKCCKDNDVSTLYKRKFDNVQEYLERKKLRLVNK